MKRLFTLAQTGMAMDDGVWRRHANPWSVYSRMTLLPLLSLALWSRVWFYRERRRPISEPGAKALA